MRTNILLPLFLSVLFVFSCKNDDDSVNTTDNTNQTDTIEVTVIDTLKPFGIEEGCLLSVSIDSAEILWNRAVQEHNGNYIYYNYNFLFCCDVILEEVTVENNFVTRTVDQYNDNTYNQVSQSINYESYESAYDQIYDRCRGLEREADSLNTEFELSYSPDGVICNCSYYDENITCPDCDPIIREETNSFKWTD